MPFTGTILLLFQDGDLREAGLAYSLELARRLAAPLTILMLLEGPEGPEDARWRSHLEAAIARLAPTGANTRTASRRGDRRSELLKFMAMSPPVSTIVWGGDERALSRGGHRTPRHWLTELRSSLSCPIVTPVSQGANPHAALPTEDR